MPTIVSDLVQVAKASASDVPSIRRFIIAAWKEAGPKAWGWTGATDKNIAELAAETTLRKLVSSSGSRLTVAKLGGSIVGFAATRDVDEHRVELAGIVVLESVKGKGIGKALIKEVIGTVSKRGIDEIIVKTEPFNERAIRFYETNGFSKVGPSKEEVDGKSLDLVVLRRSNRHVR